MIERFNIPGRFDPSYSVLGRFLRKRTRDRLQAEYRYLLAAGLVIAACLAAVAAWAGGLASELSGWASAAAVLVCIASAALTLAGWKSPIVVELGETSITARPRRRTAGREVSYAAVSGVGEVSRDGYWQHYRRFARVHGYFVRLYDPLILVRTTEDVFILGIRPAEQRRFLERLRRRVPASTARVA